MHDTRPKAGTPGGIPDGLLVGLLAFLLGLAALVWTSTGLAALFSKGAWPSTVTFTRTPGAVRALIAQPHDVPGAWPATDPAALSGWGLFWGLFISQLLVLFVLTIFMMGVIARTKARRANPAPAASEARGPEASSRPAHPTPAGPYDPTPPPHPAPPASEARGPGGSAPSNSRPAVPTPAGP
ncbi:type VI secretion protein, partial [Streptomyces sp. NPDC050448]